MSGHWNYRVLAHSAGEETRLAIHEVYYSQNDELRAHSTDPAAVTGDTPEEIMWILARMQEALTKPTLTPDLFPPHTADG
jgi:hypothetical protein